MHPGPSYPRGVADGTRPCEGRGSGSTHDEVPCRWSQMARQPAATRSQWVRFPPASLTANCRFGLHLKNVASEPPSSLAVLFDVNLAAATAGRSPSVIGSSPITHPAVGWWV